MVVDYTPITGGYSRAMSRFWVEDAGARRGYVMRADPPPGQSILETDRAVEWNVLQAVHAQGGVRIPTPLWFDPDGSELGSPAFISENVEGDTLHVLANAGTEDTNRQYIDRLAGLIADVHRFDIDKLPADLERPASWDSYIDGCISAWREAEAVHVEREPFMRTVAAWLDAHRPPPAPLTLVHGDFQGPNIVVQRDTGEYHFVDWELAHVGDPREDLGWWTLAMGSQPPDLIAQNTEAFYSRYRELTGISPDIVNPATVAYFTVLSSFTVFNNLIKMTSRLARGEPMGTSVAYMTNAMPYMHSAWINSMRAAGHWTKEDIA
jgi:aminoglycoside phosphotransferase (APT) family kinase protein